MSWATRFRVRLYVGDSLWVLPLLAIVLGILLGVVDVQVDKSVHPPAAWTYSASTATTVLSAIVGALAALTGFVVTVTVLVAQMAIGTFSARYMRIWYRDPMLKAILAVLIGTFVFAFSLLRRVENNFVPNLGVATAGLLVVVSLLLFMVFLSRYLHQLRPVAVASLMTGYVDRDFKRLFAAVADAPDVFATPFHPGGEQPALTVRSTAAGAIQAIDVEGLVRWARRHDYLLVLHHRVGDSVTRHATLIEAYGGSRHGAARDERSLQRMVAIGIERTVEQDPAFAMRIIVDVAAKALSAAINDPTTAVQVLNQLGEVLRIIGTTELQSFRPPGNGDRPQHGLVMAMRSWDEYLALGVTEIREYGSTSIQVMRRLRAMLEELRGEVLPEHRDAVGEELTRLNATVAQSFGDSIDLESARIADPLGIGGQVGPPNRHALTH
jgi:uncharacterized membrane protein